MLLPHPESEIDLTTMVLGARILDMLQRNGAYMFVEAALDEFLKADNRRTAEMFLDALCVLFALGFIEYRAYRIRINQVEGQLDLFGEQA
jgi:hypothetical protein